MEPTLPAGRSIMFDRSRRIRRDRGIYVVRTNGGLIVKRAARRGNARVIASDNPAVAPDRRPAGADVVGEVVWVARTLIEGRQRRGKRSS